MAVVLLDDTLLQNVAGGAFGFVFIDDSSERTVLIDVGVDAATRPIDESPAITKAETDDADSKEVALPGVNLLFDGSELIPFDIGACLQARLPASLIADASAVSACLHTNK
ncbi:hypothetical protein Syun_023104 [Stephania yunnanensis]|uniref:Uncharacterized protein n=1 Tax=Stephania yunnanensis TaxID=152371 RepID=A0AAP0FLJ5_9MAGN